MGEQNFNNKRIILVCREEFSKVLFFLARKLMINNTVSLFYVKPSETNFNNNTSNSDSYYYIKDHLNVQVFTTNDIADEFTNSLKHDEIIDKDYLAKIEKQYCHYLNVNAQLVCSQVLTRHYHYRYFWKYVNDTQQLNWLIFNYKKTESILDEFKPDVILSCDNEEIGHCTLREVCFYRHIPFICVDYPKYDIYKTYSYNLGLRVNKYFEKKYHENLTKGIQTLDEELKFISDFREKEKIMHEMFKNDYAGTTQYKPESLWKAFKIFVSLCHLLVKQDILAKNFAIKKSNPVIYPSSSGYLKYFALLLLKKQILMRKNKYFKLPDNRDKYIYMPLHLIPESTTFTLSPFYVNELSIIEAISKSLPAGWKLYVKEHQAMVGERSLKFYRDVNRLPNVQMVQMNYYRDPKPWIIKSQGVITISGTTAYEAAVLGKHSVVLSDVPFSLIEGIERVRSFEDLPKAIAKFKEPLDNKHSCAAYIRTVKECGMPVDLIYLVKYATEYIKKETYKDEKFDEYIDNLNALFFKGFSLYNSNIE